MGFTPWHCVFFVMILHCSCDNAPLTCLQDVMPCFPNPPRPSLVPASMDSPIAAGHVLIRWFLLHPLSRSHLNCWFPIATYCCLKSTVPCMKALSAFALRNKASAFRYCFPPISSTLRRPAAPCAPPCPCTFGETSPASDCAKAATSLFLAYEFS